MKKTYFLFVIIGLALIHVTILNGFRLFLIKPDLLLVSVVIASLSFNLPWAIGCSIFAGMLKDIIDINIFNTLFFAIWSFLIIKLSKRIELENKYLQAALVFIIVIVNNTVKRIINFSLGNSIPFGIFFKILILESIYTVIIWLLIIRIVRPITSQNLKF